MGECYDKIDPNDAIMQMMPMGKYYREIDPNNEMKPRNSVSISRFRCFLVLGHSVGPSVSHVLNQISAKQRMTTHRWLVVFAQ